jgi:hypothetical protein
MRQTAPIYLIVLACPFAISKAVSAQTVSGIRGTTLPSNGTDAMPRPDVALPPGMTRIFDGKSLDGWVESPANSWTVKDGILASRGVARGVLYTTRQYRNYRVIFDVRHAGFLPKLDHQACVLFFGTAPAEGQKPIDALGAVQIQVPPGYTWDYRKGHNNAGKGEFKSFKHRKFDAGQWSRVELLINADRGTARMAVAQPVGSDAVEVVDFEMPDAGKVGPFALQMHNKGLFDEYANIAIEEQPAKDELVTVRTHP